MPLPRCARGAGEVRSLVRLALQYLRFGVVGLTATAVHVGAFAALIELAGLAPLAANLAAFAVAVAVSFVGHFHWTFRAQTARRDVAVRRAFVRFALVACVGLALNSLAVFVVVDLMALSYRYAIVIMVFVVPLVVFAIAKFWVFV